jgi:RNA polymerase sigma-B factor
MPSSLLSSPHATPHPHRTVATDVLARRWREHADRAARDALLQRFHPLARKLARRYDSPYEPLDDLLQVACVGLLGAIDRFDPSRGASFTAFAVPTILGELKRYFRNTGWAAHVPRGAQEMALRVDRATRELEARSGRQPRVGELAQYMEVRPEDVLDGLEAVAAHHASSLDAPISAVDGEEPDALCDAIGADDDGYSLVEATATLVPAIALLPCMERRVLVMRLRRDMTQAEIGRELGCSQMQVSRLLRRAVTRLREMSDPDLEDPDSVAGDPAPAVVRTPARARRTSGTPC